MDIPWGSHQNSCITGWIHRFWPCSLWDPHSRPRVQLSLRPRTQSVALEYLPLFSKGSTSMVLRDKQEHRVDMVFTFARMESLWAMEAALGLLYGPSFWKYPFRFCFFPGLSPWMDDSTAPFPAFSHMPKDYETMTALILHLEGGRGAMWGGGLVLTQSTHFSTETKRESAWWVLKTRAHHQCPVSTTSCST